MEDIEYYLNHAKSAPRAINLALIGDRASGKTSLLNMIEGGARQRGFCVVRIDLDESDVQNQLTFFLKLFDGILTSACKEGAFGGLQGRTYDVYRGMVDALETPDDRTFCPFIFPIQYAKAMSKGNSAVFVSDVGFRDGISLIQSEINKPIAILIDECDVLAQSRVHLEKFRNIFMNISGFFLVFTGTGAFFPLINDVFSPIIRQFKKINVKPFDSQKETKDCIQRPLKALGVNVNEIFDFETYQDVQAIHELSGGRPYEIQLICHQLFRRMQIGKASKLQLSVDVLDDVLKELQSLQDLTVRPVVQKIRGLTVEELSALNTLLVSNRLISFDQAWFIEYIFNTGTEWTRDSLKEKVEFLTSNGVIRCENGILSFAGDDFDRIYCKYYSRKLDIYETINDIPFDLRFRFGIDAEVRNNLPCVQMEQHYYGDTDGKELERIIDEFSKQDFGFFDTNPELAKALYRANLQNQDSASFSFVQLDVLTPWNRLYLWYTIEASSDECDRIACLADFERVLSDVRERASQLDAMLSVRVFDIPVIDLESIAKRAIACKSQAVRADLAEAHCHEMHEYYTEKKDLARAKFHGELSLQFAEPEDVRSANDLGYLLMATGSIEKAILLFESSSKQETNPPDYLAFLGDALDNYFEGLNSLVNYNLGIAYAMKQDIERASEYLSVSIEQATGQEEHKCACLFVPSVIDKKLEFTEVLDPDLLETAKSSLQTLREFSLK